jgi:hypothetical protein
MGDFSPYQRGKIMDRGKIVAIITGVISVILAIAYLVLVQLLDFRGEMLPAPIDDFSALFFRFLLA